jgi:hypothetical protein
MSECATAGQCARELMNISSRLPPTTSPPLSRSTPRPTVCRRAAGRRRKNWTQQSRAGESLGCHCCCGAEHQVQRHGQARRGRGALAPSMEGLLFNTNSVRMTRSPCLGAEAGAQVGSLPAAMLDEAGGIRQEEVLLGNWLPSRQVLLRERRHLPRQASITVSKQPSL